VKSSPFDVVILILTFCPRWNGIKIVNLCDTRTTRTYWVEFIPDKR
jgi:hypothetical protein